MVQIVVNKIDPSESVFTNIYMHTLIAHYPAPFSPYFCSDDLFVAVIGENSL